MVIESNNNKLIKEVKSLFKKKNRDKLGLYVVEGINMVEEILTRGYPCEYILYSKRLLEIQGGKSIYNSLLGLNEAYEVDEKLLNNLSDTLTPQGVIGVCKKIVYRLDSLDLAKTYVFLDKLQDPGNMGTIIRSADAFSIGGIILNKGTVDPYNPKVVRASMGSVFRVPIYYVGDTLEDLAGLKNLGFKLYATSLEDSRNIRDINFKSSIVAIGNEAVGVSQEVFGLASEKIRIEMPGESESLNAGVAASIIMYEAFK